MKRTVMLSIVLLLALLLFPFMLRTASADVSSGTCGDDLVWIFDSDTGVLSIEGSGDMDDYTYSTENDTRPWSSYLKIIKTIVIGNGVTSIGSEAFHFCSAATTVEMSSTVTKIHDNAFFFCGALTEVTIPDSVTEIGERAFYGCNELVNVVISDGAVSIGEKCFYGCENLTKVTLPCSVRIDDPYTFSYPAGTYYVTKIESVHLTKGTGAMVNNPGAPWKRTTRDIKSLILDEGIRSICDNAFSGIQISTLTIPDSVSFIGKAAFGGRKLMELTLPCSARLSEQSGLFTNGGTVHITKGTGVMADHTASTALPWRSCSEITIDEGVTYIGKYAFHDCVNFSETFIPDSVETIGEYAYSGCTGLTSVDLPAGLKQIGDNAFSGCTGLTSVEIPDGVTYLSGFSACTGLKSISIPTSVNEIGVNAFSGCTNLKSVSIPSNVKRIDEAAFKGCTALTSVSLNYGTETIGNSAFSGCTRLSTISLPASVQSFGDSVFSGCTNLRSASLENGLRNIGNSMFSDCKSLTEIVVPDSVSGIGDNAFSNCIGLTSVTIGKNVSKIGNGAFQGCTEYCYPEESEPIKYVYYHGTRRMKACIQIGSDNGPLTAAQWRCLSPIGIIMEEMPDKCIYHQGEPLSVDGGTITAYYEYNINETEEITESMLLDEYDPERTGKQTLTVKFGGCVTEFQITVNPHEPGEAVRENEVDPTYTAYGHYDEAVYCTVCHAELDRATYNIPMLPFNGSIEWDSNDIQYKGTTAYVISNWDTQTPRFTVKNTLDGNTIDPSCYVYEYRENRNAGTGYVFVTFTGDYTETIRASFKIYLPATTSTTVANIQAGIKLTWDAVPGAAGYVIYRRAWSTTTNGWTAFARWDNTTDTTYLDGHDDAHKVYAGTRYQYGVKAYFARRMDPISGEEIGGNINNPSGNYNLGEVGPLKTTVRITTRTLTSVTGGLEQGTVKWTGSSLFTGYEVQYATNAAFTENAVKLRITDPKTTQKVIYNLKTSVFEGMQYYVRIRSYHVFNGVTYYGGWSLTKSLTATPKYRAVMIGESDYSSIGATSLPGCAYDALTMSGMLGGLNPSFATTGKINATYSQIMDLLWKMKTNSTDESVSLFYYSGHGMKDYGSVYHGALVTVDNYYITFSELAEKLSRVKGRVIVILDSCFSGASIDKSVDGDDELAAFNNAVIEAFSGYDLQTGENGTVKSGELKKSKFVVITAASYDQSSWDGRYDGSGYAQGAFTAALIRGMGSQYISGAYTGSMPADKNNDKRVTLKELYDYTYSMAKLWTTGSGSPQYAQYYGTDSEVLFSR